MRGRTHAIPQAPWSIWTPILFWIVGTTLGISSLVDSQEDCSYSPSSSEIAFEITVSFWGKVLEAAFLESVVDGEFPIDVEKYRQSGNYTQFVDQTLVDKTTGSGVCFVTFQATKGDWSGIQNFNCIPRWVKDGCFV